MTTQLTDWIATHGLLAVFLLMAIDAVLPAGGEVVMLFGGALAAGAVAGHTGPPLEAVIAAGTLGYLAGSVAGWAIGRAGGRGLVARHGHWLHLGPRRFRRAERWFSRYGASFVFFGRLVPLVRSFVSIPAGVLEFPLARYVLISAVASLAWCAAFAVGGFALGTRWESLHRSLHSLDYAVAAAAILAVGLLAVRARARAVR